MVKNGFGILVLSIGAVIASWFLLSRDVVQDDIASEVIASDGSAAASNSVPSSLLQNTFSDSDLTQSLVNFDLVLSGGVAKDGIPAISNPTFDPLSSATTPGDTLGIFIENGDVQKFYPYNILVSHEIVNDTINEREVAVTFCPLCGSAIVFDREVDGEVKEFGVSGFLYESNLIMYDRTETPSLWSQARGEAIIGDQAGTKLSLVDFQLLTLADVRQLHPDASILSTDTGFSRSYDFDPYSGYDASEETIFPVSVDDNRFPTKEVFYVVPGIDSSTAIRVSELARGQSAESTAFDLRIEKTEDGELIVRDRSGESKVGYYEMWFSWAQHHQDNGQVWDLSEI